MSKIPNDIPSQNVMKDDFGWEIPVETVPIPSVGSVYPQDSPLYNRKTLQIKAMTAREEDILSSAALIKEGTVITHLINSCLIDKSFDVRDMLLGDRNALMVSIRITGYGSQYDAEATCPECAERSDQSFDLSALEIKPIEIDPVKPGENLFSFKLPVTKKNVKFRFMTGRDEEERSITAERKKKLMPGVKIESGVTSRLEQLVVSIDSVIDRNKISQFIRNMPALDSKNLRTYISEHEPGIDMTTWMRCPHCSETSKITLPMGSNFFWPER